MRILNTTLATWFSNTVSLIINHNKIFIIVVVGDDYSGDNDDNPDGYGYAQCQDSSGHEDETVSTYLFHTRKL